VARIGIHGLRDTVNQWLPGLIASANGNGLEVQPGVKVFFPEAWDVMLQPDGDRLIVTFSVPPRIEVDKTALCARVKLTGTVDEANVGTRTIGLTLGGLPDQILELLD